MDSDSHQNFESHLDTARGIFGTMLSAGTLIFSHLEVLEAWLRVLSLLVGISVGMVTIWSILRKRK